MPAAVKSKILHYWNYVFKQIEMPRWGKTGLLIEWLDGLVDADSERTAEVIHALISRLLLVCVSINEIPDAMYAPRMCPVVQATLAEKHQKDRSDVMTTAELPKGYTAMIAPRRSLVRGLRFIGRTCYACCNGDEPLMSLAVVLSTLYTHYTEESIDGDSDGGVEPLPTHYELTKSPGAESTESDSEYVDALPAVSKSSEQNSPNSCPGVQQHGGTADSYRTITPRGATRGVTAGRTMAEQQATKRPATERASHDQTIAKRTPAKQASTRQEAIKHSASKRKNNAQTTAKHRATKPTAQEHTTTAPRENFELLVASDVIERISARRSLHHKLFPQSRAIIPEAAIPEEAGADRTFQGLPDRHAAVTAQFACQEKMHPSHLSPSCASPSHSGPSHLNSRISPLRNAGIHDRASKPNRTPVPHHKLLASQRLSKVADREVMGPPPIPDAVERRQTRQHSVTPRSPILLRNAMSSVTSLAASDTSMMSTLSRSSKGYVWGLEDDQKLYAHIAGYLRDNIRIDFDDISTDFDGRTAHSLRNRWSKIRAKKFYMQKVRNTKTNAES